MTAIACPSGCGGFVDTAVENYCKSCRRSLATSEVIIAENQETETAPDCMKARKMSWCWEWFGPVNHRMKCRLQRGHDGEHDPHEVPTDCTIISTDGELIREAEETV